jgi:signal transduction histidine kinase
LTWESSVTLGPRRHVGIRCKCECAIRRIYCFGGPILDAAGEQQHESGNGLDHRRLERLIDVGRVLVSELDLEVVLDRVLEAARELTCARYAALGVLDERRTALERFLTRGVDQETATAIGDLPHGRGVLGVLISDPKPLRLRDVGDHPRSYGFPPAHPPMRTFLGVPVLIRGEAYGNLYLTEKEGGDFSEADEQAAVVLADWAAIAIENARLYKAVWDRREELERAVRGLEATSEIARALGGETDLERVLELIAKRGRALADARSLLILLEEEGELAIAATAGEAVVSGRGKRLRAGLVSEAMRSGRAQRISDVAALRAMPAAEIGVSAESALLVPMLFRGRPVGVLVAFDRTVDGPEFRPEDEELMLSFAASAATAVHTAKSVATERLRESMAASEEERRRWARELHDETLQALGALRIALSSALQRGSPEGLAAAVRDSVDQIASEIESLRNLIAELRPAALDEIGLEPAIESLAERFAETAGSSVETRIDLKAEGEEASARLATDLETTIYRLVQEALTNVAKHARAERVVVEVRRKDSRVDVAVEDDGIGFEPERPSSGFGLTGMRERVALAGGSLQVRSTPGSGTTIRASLPVELSAAR